MIGLQELRTPNVAFAPAQKLPPARSRSFLIALSFGKSISDFVAFINTRQFLDINLLLIVISYRMLTCKNDFSTVKMRAFELDAGSNYFTRFWPQIDANPVAAFLPWLGD